MQNTTTSNHVYFNLIFNNKSTESKVVDYQANLGSSLFRNDRLSDYKIAVVRSQINTSLLPVHRFYGSNGGTTNFETDVSLSMSYLGNKLTENIVWVGTPEDTGITPNDSTIQYGDIYSFQKFCDFVNDVFVILTADLKSGFGMPGTVNAPLLIFDGNSDKFTLIVDVALYSTGDIVIELSTQLAMLLKGFATNTVQGGVELIIKERPNNYWPAPITPSATLGIEQDYSTLSNFNPIQSVFIETNIPIRNVFERDEQTKLLTETSILRDYILFLSDENTSLGNSSVISFSDEYEMADAQMSTPLKSINAYLFWRDTLGNKYRLLQPPKSSSSVKLMFYLPDAHKSTSS
jgi:hypothetical protein